MLPAKDSATELSCTIFAFCIKQAPSLSLLLRDYRDKVHQQRLILGKPLSDDDFVFAHEDGTPLDPSTVTHTFGKVVRKAGLELRLHDLRHSYASLMLAAGADMKQISSNLGHSNVGITFDTYGHLISGAGKIAAERFDRLLKSWLPRAKMSAKCWQTRRSQARA